MVVLTGTDHARAGGRALLFQTRDPRLRRVVAHPAEVFGVPVFRCSESWFMATGVRATEYRHQSFRRQGVNCLFNIFKKKPKFPPVPDWRPSIRQPIDRIVERVSRYTDRKTDFAVFNYGTCVVLPDDLSEDGAANFAKEVLAQILNYHPDMNPMLMKDGNILVRYNHPAVNVVLNDVAVKHWAEIDNNHQRALATSEALITPRNR